jgi:hypothetical protein
VGPKREYSLTHHQVPLWDWRRWGFELTRFQTNGRWNGNIHVTFGPWWLYSRFHAAYMAAHPVKPDA